MSQLMEEELKHPDDDRLPFRAQPQLIDAPDSGDDGFVRSSSKLPGSRPRISSVSSYFRDDAPVDPGASSGMNAPHELEAEQRILEEQQRVVEPLAQEDDDADALIDPPAQVAAPQAPSSFASSLQQRKQAAAAVRGDEPEVAPQPVGRAASRAGWLDKGIGVGNWLGKGVHMTKEASDTAVLYGRDIPEFVDAVGESNEALRGGADTVLEKYAPAQQFFQQAGAYTDAAGKFLNPIPKVEIGEVGGQKIKLGLGTKDVITAATGIAEIAQYHKNEGADPLATAGDERAAFTGIQGKFRRDMEARRRIGRLMQMNDADRGEGDEAMATGMVDSRLKGLKRNAALSSFRSAGLMGLRAGQLAKAQEKKGMRPLNEYSMAQTAYLNDKKFVPRAPLGFNDKEGADAFTPTVGMLDPMTGNVMPEHKAAAGAKVWDKYADKGANYGQRPPEGLFPTMRSDNALEALPDGYRDDVEGGRSMQWKVAPARFGVRAGELVEGSLNTDRMARDGRYKTAYAAKVADAAAVTGAKAAAGATQAGLVAATGGVAAPLIAAAEAGKHLAFHAKREVGKGMQSASSFAERVIDPRGVAREQDNRDLYNKHFGLAKPDAAANPVAGQQEPAIPEEQQPVIPEQQQPVGDEAQVADQQPVAGDDKGDLSSLFAEAPKPEPIGDYDPVAQLMNRKNEYFGMPKHEFLAAQQQRNPALAQLEQAQQDQNQPLPAQPEAVADQEPDQEAGPSARSGDVAARGVHWEKQGDRSVVGRQRRTWARAAKDLTWGGVKAVGKGLWEGIKGLVTLPIHAAKWAWKGISTAGKYIGKGAKGLWNLMTGKKKKDKQAEPENKARAALKALQGHSQMGDLDRPQFDLSAVPQEGIDALSEEEKAQFEAERQKYDQVFGAKNDEGQRVGGTRQAAKDALMAKPEVARAEETAALREQLAPGAYTPRMASGEILEMLRGRDREFIVGSRRAMQQIDGARGGGGPGGGGPGGGGPGDGGPGPDDGGPGSALLDQMSELEGSESARTSEDADLQEALKRDAQENAHLLMGGGGAQQSQRRQGPSPHDYAGRLSVDMDPEDPDRLASRSEAAGELQRDSGGAGPKASGEVPGMGWQGNRWHNGNGGWIDEEDVDPSPSQPVQSQSAPVQPSVAKRPIIEEDEEKIPNDNAHYAQFGRHQGHYADEEEEDQAIGEQPVAQQEAGQPEASNDRGLLDNFDAEFASGAPLNDDDFQTSVPHLQGIRRQSHVVVENMGMGVKILSEAPARAPKTVEEEEKERARVYKKTKYMHEGKALKTSTVRGEGEAPLPPKPSWWSRTKWNPKNWGAGAAAGASRAQAPAQVPGDDGLAGPSQPRHRTAAAGKGILAARGGLKHTAQTMLPENQAAQREVRNALEKEAAAGKPFEAGGAYRGKYDATLMGGSGAAVKTGLDEQANPLLTGQLLFGVQSRGPAQAPPAARKAVDNYASSMEATNAAELQARTAVARQVRADQGETAMPGPDFIGNGRAYRTPFYNGYWMNGEMNNPKPTAKARSGKQVRFDASAEQVPVDQRDPNRPFAQAQAPHLAEKARRRAEIDAGLARVQRLDPDEWALAGKTGAAIHQAEERRLFDSEPPVADDQERPELSEIAEEEKVASDDEGSQQVQLSDQGSGQGPMMMRQLVGNGEWRMMPEEEKGAGPALPQANVPAANVPAANAPAANVPAANVPSANVPQAAWSRGAPEMLDTSAAGLARHQLLMDPREMAIMRNAARPRRAAKRLPAIREAVKAAQTAETKDDATAAWRNVNQLQSSITNRRSAPAGIEDAGRRRARQGDLLGGPRMLDVSTRHEGMNLPEAAVEDRRLEAGGADQKRLRNFNLPGDRFNIYDHADDDYDYLSRLLNKPADYFPPGVEQRGEEETRKLAVAAYLTDPDRRRQIQMRDMELVKQEYPDEVMETKRVLYGDPKANGEFDSLPTDDARANMGPMTVDGREVEARHPHRMPQKPTRLDREFGAYAAHRPFGEWHDKETGQLVDSSGLLGDKDPPLTGNAAGNARKYQEGKVDTSRYKEWGSKPIAEEKRVQAPAAGWDDLKKPWFWQKEALQAYRAKKEAARAVVAGAHENMAMEDPPKFVARSKFGTKEWAKLQQQAAEDAKAKAEKDKAEKEKGKAEGGNVMNDEEKAQADEEQRLKALQRRLGTRGPII